MAVNAVKEGLSDSQVEEIRTAVRAIMQAEGLSQADVARGADIPYGTFTPWLSGKYAGDNAALALRVQRWIGSREGERRVINLALAEPGFVETPTAIEILNLLQWAKSAPGITLITAGPGMGKSACTKYFQSQNPHAYRVVMRPSTSGIHSMMSEIAQTLGVTERNPAKLTRAIGDKLRRNGRHTLIMVDEAQNLSDTSVDELRHYLDEYGCGIALLGNEDVQTRWGRATPKEGYGQLHRRIGPRLRRLRPLTEDIDTYLAAWGITDREVIKLLKVIGRKPGALGQIRETLLMANIVAAGHGRSITGADITAAWQNRGGEHVEAL